jgi:hypothetical protein
MNPVSFVLDGLDLSQLLWRDAQVHPTWAKYLIHIDRKLRLIEPTSCLLHHPPGRISGCTWNFLVDEKTQGCGLKSGLGWPPNVVAEWRIALSYRASLITAISWSQPDKGEDAVTDPKLVALVKAIANDLSPLVYIDQHRLRAFEVSWEELQGDANMRLDWSETPNAFNLLFYEY